MTLNFKICTIILVLTSISETKVFRQKILNSITALIMQLLKLNVKRNIRRYINSIIKIVLIRISQIVFNKNQHRFSGRKRLNSFNHTQKVCHKISNQISNRVKLNLFLLQLRHIQKTRSIYNLSRRLHYTTIVKFNVLSTISIIFRISLRVNRITIITIKNRNNFSQFDLILLFNNESIMKTN